MRRVVITGAGTINALGADVPSTLDAFRAGRAAIGPLDIRDADRLAIRIGAQVRGYDESAHFNRQQVALFDRYTQFALLAAGQALRQAGLEFSGERAARAGVILGTSGGGLNTQDENYRVVYEEGRNRVHPFVVPKLMNNAAAAQISMEHNLKGPSFTVATACASSNHAIGQAFQFVRAGLADVMVTGRGGGDAVLRRRQGLGGVARHVERHLPPVLRDPVGHGAGRGGGHLRAGGARCGAGARRRDTCRDRRRLDDFGRLRHRHAVAAGSGAGDGGRASRRRAERLGDRLHQRVWHGDGGERQDGMRAVAHVFGPQADRLAISSTKSMHGHCIGATGAIELLACIMALREGIIAPTANWREPDPECALDIVPNEAREGSVTACLSNAFAFGGMNAVLALRAA